MRPASFEYFRALNLNEALELLDKYGKEAKILAGGQSLLPLLKMRILSPKYIIDITRIPELHYIRELDKTIAIGALTTHYEVLSSSVIKDKCPILSKAAGYIGDLQVRNRGTMGGNVCHADPASHYLPALIALEADFIVRSKDGERIIKAKEFFKDMFTTAIKPNELLVEVRVPKLDGFRYGYESIQRRSGDLALAISSVIIKIEKGVCKSAKIVIGATSPVPIELKAAEELLIGKELNKDIIEKVASKVYEELPEPISDIKASSEYRREVARVLTIRALSSCMGGG